MTASVEDHQYEESGLDNVTLVRVDVYRCSDCDYSTVAIPRVESLHALLAELIATRPARLRGNEVRFLRKHLGWSGVRFASYMRVDPATVSRWEKGKKGMGEIAEALFRTHAINLVPLEKYNAIEVSVAMTNEAEPEDLAVERSDDGWSHVSAE